MSVYLRITVVNLPVMILYIRPYPAGVYTLWSLDLHRMSVNFLMGADCAFGRAQSGILFVE